MTYFGIRNAHKELNIFKKKQKILIKKCSLSISRYVNKSIWGQRTYAPIFVTTQFKRLMCWNRSHAFVFPTKHLIHPWKKENLVQKTRPGRINFYPGEQKIKFPSGYIKFFSKLNVVLFLGQVWCRSPPLERREAARWCGCLAYFTW